MQLTANSTRATVVWAAVIGCLAVLLSGPVEVGAKSRDSDASRMQARKVVFPSTHSDSLDPPTDRVDWRYFKLSEASRVSMRATFGTADSGAEIGLTGATGQEIASARADQNSATISQKLDPGVYYVRIQAQTKTTYKLAVRE
jgi:hypothetical protein